MSDQGYDINLNVNAPTGGLDSAIQRLKTLDRQLQQTTSRMNRMAGQVPKTEGQQADAKAIAAVKRAAEQAAQATKVATDRTQRVRVPQVRLPQGPAQRYQQAIANQQAAAVYGTPAQQFDANRAAQIAGKQYQAAIKATAGDSASKTGTAVARALKSARIGFGPEGFSVSPLLGAIGEFGPLGLAIGGVVGALQALKGVADSAAESQLGYTRAQNAAGGTPQETALIRGIAAAAGQTPEQGAQTARALAQSLHDNPFTQSALARYGVTPDPDPQGVMNPDKARNFIKTIEALFQMSPEQAQRTLNTLPSGFGAYYAAFQGLTPQERQQYFQQAEAQAGAFGPDAQRQAALYNMQQTQFEQNQQTVKAAAGRGLQRQYGPVFQAGAQAIQNPGISSITRAALEVFNLISPDPASQARRALQALGIGGSGPSAAGAGTGGPSAAIGAQRQATSSLDANTQAIRDLTWQLGDAKRHVFGGGPRTEGAVPAGWRGQALNDARLGGMDRRLGVFVQ